MNQFDPMIYPVAAENRRDGGDKGGKKPMPEPQEPNRPTQDPSRMPGERPGQNPINDPEYTPGQTPTENPGQPGRTGEIFPPGVPNTGEVQDPSKRDVNFSLENSARQRRDDEDLPESDDTVNMRISRDDNTKGDEYLSDDDTDEWSDDDADLDIEDEDEV